MPAVLVEGDFILFLGDYNKLADGTREKFGTVKVFFNIKRRQDARIVVPFDFMNMEWKRFKPSFNYTVQDEKVENYTSVL